MTDKLCNVDDATHVKEFFNNNEFHNRERIVSLSENIANLPGASGKDPYPLFHRFADGMYTREVHIPQDALIVGAIHRNEYFINVVKGRILVMSEFGSKEIVAPCSFIAKAGVKHIGYTLEDTVWIDTHKCSTENIEEAEKEIFADSYEDLDMGNNIIDGEYASVVTELGFTEDEVRTISENTSDMIFDEQDDIEIKSSDIEGLGVFAVKDFNNGDVIGTGRIKFKRTLIGRYTNHSSTPNAISRIENNNAVFVAIDNIYKGDEVTVDYRNARNTAKELDSINIHNEDSLCQQ